MSTKQFELSENAINKALAHLLKYQKSNCTGVLLGTRKNGLIEVVDSVPLFHDRVMLSALETALEIVDSVYSD